jgi:hypothetical protein
MVAGRIPARALTLATSLLLLCSACTSGAASSSQLVTADPSHVLLTLSDMPSAGFTVVEPEHAVNASTLASGKDWDARQLMQEGFQAAATVRYLRAVDLTIANGPVEVIDAVERFATATGATDRYNARAKELDNADGAIPTSTGPLGDAAHADSIVRTTSGGVPAIQVTLLWRVANIVNVIVIRGRYGGTRVEDALPLARVITQREVSSAHSPA